MGLRDEILEQPEVFMRLLESSRRVIEPIAAEIRGLDIDLVYLVARGSSDNAGLYASYILGSENRLPVAPALPSLFTLYRRPPKLKRCLVIAISQSGRSPDLIAAVDEATHQGAMTLVITNSPDSPLANRARWVIDIQAGTERSVAATKTYTAQVLALALLSAALSGNTRFRAELDQIPALAREVLRTEEPMALAARSRRELRQCIVLGRGFDYGTAHEWELKLKELAYVLADSYSSADFRHGPIAVVERGFTVLAVNADGEVSEDMAGLLRSLHDERRADLVVVSNSDLCLRFADQAIRMPAYPERLSPILSIIPGQLFAYHLTSAKGYDVDHPRGLRKVTETT